jgi:hypothetical protein
LTVSHCAWQRRTRCGKKCQKPISLGMLGPVRSRDCLAMVAPAARLLANSSKNESSSTAHVCPTLTDRTSFKAFLVVVALSEIPSPPTIIDWFMWQIWAAGIRRSWRTFHACVRIAIASRIANFGQGSSKTRVQPITDISVCSRLADPARLERTTSAFGGQRS